MFELVLSFVGATILMALPALQSAAMAELRLRKRVRMKQKEIAVLAADLEAQLGAKVFSEADTVDAAEGPEYNVVFVDGRVLALVVNGRPMLTVRGLLAYTPTKRYVTVDMGAVPYVYNGADIMAPGIVDADSGIAPGDFVWVRDERNLRPLAIGEALLSGAEMIAREKGKAVQSIHHVGDDLWRVDEQG